MAADENLDRRIKALPQELQDEILDHVLFIKPSTVVISRANYKSPWQLSISRATRKKVAEHYYGTSTFTFEDAPFFQTLVGEWLVALSKAHQALISDIRIRVPHYFSADLLNDLINDELGIAECECASATTVAEAASDYLRSDYDICLGQGVLKNNYSLLIKGCCAGEDCKSFEFGERWTSENGPCP